MKLEFINEGMTWVVDKPYGWTSFDVVNKLRWHLKRKFKLKKVKVGHAGTLDPLATGVLVICIGKHTKRIDELMAGKKTYTGKLLLGKTTASNDLETPFDPRVSPTEHICQADLQSLVGQFTGTILQTPPIFSAKQIEGKRAYDLAREGKTPVLAAVPVTIHELELQGASLPEVSFKVTCTKGTYIRSLVRDIGEALGTGATMTELRREASGDQTLLDAKHVEEWIDFIENGKD